MRIDGKMHQEKDGWIVEVPILGVFTQGDSIEEAREMARDAVGLMLEDHTDGKVTEKDVKVIQGEAGTFELETAATKALTTLILRQVRSNKKLSQAELAALMGVSSRNAIGQYEEGRSEPGLAKLQEILGAMGYEFKLTLVPKAV
jgi:predicted RNase H-like HicB family nuclease/DNA-binding XRE family transcriptional regulator